jgi:hypothetical protein
LPAGLTDDRIAVVDGLYPDGFIREVQDALLCRGWTYSEGAYPGSELVHWVTELSPDDAWVATLLSGFRSLIDRDGSYRLIRAYCNAHVCSDCPLPHQDSANPRDRTVLVYANAQWQPEFAGETVFFDDHDEIIRAVMPRPGRVVIFDSTLRHCARPPTRILLGLRLTVAFKLQAVEA